MKRRYLVLFVALPVVMVLALVVFYRIEDRRGTRAWEAVKGDLRSRGEPLELAAFAPPPVPDERSLAKAPVIVLALKEGYIPPGSARPAAWSDMPYGRGGSEPNFSKDSWKTGRPLSLADWQKLYAKSTQCPHPAQSGEPAADVMLALTIFAPLLDELVRETETRAQAFAPVDWQVESAVNVRFPAGPLFMKMANTLRLRASAELADDRHGDALRDTLAALRLCEALGCAPLMIGFLEGNVSTSLALQPIWEGLATRRWTADELRRIEEALQRDNQLTNYVQAMRGDRAICCSTLESVRKSSANGEAVLSGGTGKPSSPAIEWMAKVFTMVPRGWIDQNKASACRLYQGYIDALDPRTQRVSLEKVAAADAAIKSLGEKPYLVYTLLSRVAVPTGKYLLSRAARVQTACDQAFIACALERCYLDRHTYPDSLDSLVPAYLERVPGDVMDDAPMRYRRTDDGRYLLYGVGWNGRDDGGTVAWTRGSSAGDPPRPNDNEGDWVWQYQPMNPPAGMR